MSKTVGELNGVNAALFRLNMALIPIMFTLLITWGAWVTASLFQLKAFADVGDRWTRDMDRATMAENWERHRQDVEKMKQELHGMIDRHNP